MQRLIHTIASTAALAATFVAIGRNYSLWVTFKSVFISYLAFFFVASLLVLIYRGGVLAENKTSAPEEKEAGGNSIPTEST